MKIILLVLCSVLTCPWLFGQGNIDVTVVSNAGEALPGAQFLIPGTPYGGIADHLGKLVISKVPPGEHFYKVSFLGYQTLENKLLLHSDENLLLTVRLVEETSGLNEVVISGKGVVEQIRQAPFTVNVLDIRPLHTQSVPLTGLIGQVAGVRVRESGGMGSGFNIMLNGIGGKGVRIFVDDIPADLLGSGLALNNLPVNMIDRVEIYKGVIPARFGSDALGGVLNLVTRTQAGDFLDASLTAGSWGTRQASINTAKFFGARRQYFLGINGGYSYSDNNYWMDNVSIRTDNYGNTEKGRVRRFHDQYLSYLGQVEAGLQNEKWADELRMTVSVSQTDKDWQHGLTAESPWGEPFSRQGNLNTALKWKKAGLLSGRLDASLVAGYNYYDLYFEDTSSRSYYWGAVEGLPRYTSKVTVGESGLFVDGTNPRVFNRNIFSRANLLYALGDHHKISFTSFFTAENIKGHDQRGVATYKKDPLANPQALQKNYLGIALESRFLGEKLVNILSLKHFYSKAEVADISVDQLMKGQKLSRFTKPGFGNAVRYQILPVLSVSANYEYTVRLPDSEEIFGNFISIISNAEIRPETSHNINAGIRYKSSAASHLPVSAEINGFYRQTSDRIFLSVLNQSKSAYMNLLSTVTSGLEAEVKYMPLKTLTVFMNGTWQDTRLRKADEGGKISPRYIGARVPNMPWLYANMGFNYLLPAHIVKTDRISFFYTFNYVHDFLLSWEVDGVRSSKATIPEQLIHGAGIGYQFPGEKLTLSAECRNISNERAYDNYLVQKPGRSAFLKLRLFLGN